MQQEKKNIHCHTVLQLLIIIIVAPLASASRTQSMYIQAYVKINTVCFTSIGHTKHYAAITLFSALLRALSNNRRL